MKDPFEGAVAVGLEEMLAAREERARLQAELLAGYGGTLICLTIVTPGGYKRYPLADRAFDEGVGLVLRGLRRHGLYPVHRQVQRLATGCEAYLLVREEARRVKELLLSLEENHPLGRILDLDVLKEGGRIVSRRDLGRGERACLVCGGPVWECARSRRHSYQETAARAAGLMEAYFAGMSADSLAEKAVQALLWEVAVTPKPGLVDRENNGAHRDMDFFSFCSSASALFPYFREVAWAGVTWEGSPDGLMSRLRLAGQEAEDHMRLATGGANTHKGAIFSLGLACAAAGYLGRRLLPQDSDSVLELCGRIFREGKAYRCAVSCSERNGGTVSPDTGAIPMGDPGIGISHGEMALVKYGVDGVRGEAARGYPTLRRYGYPALLRCLEQGESPNDAGVTALLCLLAHARDTNVFHRAGPDTAEEIRYRVRDFLAESPSVEQIKKLAWELDREFVQRNISPGGCADLLAMGFFLVLLQSGPEKQVAHALSQ